MRRRVETTRTEKRPSNSTQPTETLTGSFSVSPSGCLGRQTPGSPRKWPLCIDQSESGASHNGQTEYPGLGAGCIRKCLDRPRASISRKVAKSVVFLFKPEMLYHLRLDDSIGGTIGPNYLCFQRINNFSKLLRLNLKKRTISGLV